MDVRKEGKNIKFPCIMKKGTNVWKCALKWTKTYVFYRCALTYSQWEADFILTRGGWGYDVTFAIHHLSNCVKEGWTLMTSKKRLSALLTYWRCEFKSSPSINGWETKLAQTTSTFVMKKRPLITRLEGYYVLFYQLNEFRCFLWKGLCIGYFKTIQDETAKKLKKKIISKHH